MSDEVQETEVEQEATQTTMVVRIHEWSEWLPTFGSEAARSFGVQRGVSFFSLAEGEKLVKLEPVGTGQVLKCTIIPGGDGEATVLKPEDVPPWIKENGKLPDNSYQQPFQLYVFQATIVAKTDLPEAPAPWLQHSPQANVGGDIATAASMPVRPPNRHERRNGR